MAARESAQVTDITQPVNGACISGAVYMTIFMIFEPYSVESHLKSLASLPLTWIWTEKSREPRIRIIKGP
jgi:hypothetical protein